MQHLLFQKLPSAKPEPDPHQQRYNSNEFLDPNKPQRNYNDPESRQQPPPARVQNDDRGFRGNRNDRNWQNDERYKRTNDVEEPYRPPTGNPNFGQASFNRDKRLDQRNKFNNANGYQNPKNQGSYQQRPYENTYRDNADSGRKFQRFNENPRNTDRYQNSDRRSNDIEDLVHRASQVKLHGYDMQGDGNVFIPSKPFLKPGSEVNAKYWEDEKVGI